MIGFYQKDYDLQGFSAKCRSATERQKKQKRHMKQKRHTDKILSALIDLVTIDYFSLFAYMVKLQ
jgi:ribonuclease PH